MATFSALQLLPRRQPTPQDRRQLLQAVQRQVLLSQQAALHVRQQLQARQMTIKGAASKSRTPTIQLQTVPQTLVQLQYKVWSLQYAAQANEKLSSTQAVADLFSRTGVDGRLLILGEPGSGKTQTLLALADKLLKTSRSANGPIPVLLDVSSWQGEPIRAWIIDQLWQHYRVSQSCAEVWVDTAALTLLIDGFDHLSTQGQRTCTASLESLMRGNINQTVVLCCRRKTLERTGINFTEFNSGIHILPLVAQQVKDYALGVHRADLWSGIKGSKILQQIARSPLMLNLLVETYDGQPIANQADLTQRYGVKQLSALAADRKEPTQGASPSREALGWLAQQLGQRQRTFYLESLTPQWLPSSQGLLYRLLVWGCIALIVTLAGRPLLGLAVGMVASQIDIDTFPRFRLSLASLSGRAMLPVLAAMILPGLGLAMLLGMLVGGIAAQFGGSPQVAATAAAFGLMSGAIMGGLALCNGGVQNSIQFREIPNQDTFFALRNLGLIGLLLAGLLLGLLAIISSFNGIPFTQLAPPDSLKVVVALLIAFCLWASHALQHGVLRLLLSLSKPKPLPLNATQWLNAAVEHKLLQRSGGGYAFIHEKIRAQLDPSAPR